MAPFRRVQLGGDARHRSPRPRRPWPAAMSTWKSTGRLPIRSPPTRDQRLAGQMQQRSEQEDGDPVEPAELQRDGRAGRVGGATVSRSPSRSTDRADGSQDLRRDLHVTDVGDVGDRARARPRASAATMCLVTAFLEPRTCNLAAERPVGLDQPGVGHGPTVVPARRHTAALDGRPPPFWYTCEMAAALLVPSDAGPFPRAGAGGHVVGLSAAPPTTAGSPLVTLEPTGPAGSIPGDASDSWDFYGLGLAVIAIVIVLVLARAVVGGRPPGRQSRGER